MRAQYHKVVDPNALREARARIRQLLETPITFNGAGEPDLPSVSQVRVEDGGVPLASLGHRSRDDRLRLCFAIVHTQ